MWSSRDWPAVHGIPQCLPASVYTPAKDKPLPCVGASVLVHAEAAFVEAHFMVVVACTARWLPQDLVYFKYVLMHILAHKGHIHAGLFVMMRCVQQLP